jgi:two-component system phosphate regulon sensor histidine kinase PhoR
MQHHKKIYRKNVLFLIVIISILSVLALQAYSLYSQYNYLLKIVLASYEESLNTSIAQYRSYRYDQFTTEQDTISIEITGMDSRKNKSNNENIDELFYNVNSHFIAITPFEINTLDSIYCSILKEKEIESEYKIIILKHQSDSILEQNLEQESISYKFHTPRKALDSMRDVQICFKNPLSLIFRKMAFSFVFSFVMLIVIIIALIYQSRIISKQKQIEIVRQDFIDSMTHELRHPLQGALSLSEILNNEKMAENDSLRNNIIGRLKANLQNLERLLHSLVVQSYAENLQTTAHWQQGNLKNCIDEIIATCSISNTKLIHFKTDYSDGISLCWFDPMHFPNAIKNLIENSIKYSNEEVTIAIRAEINNERLEVTVKDNGTGIAKEDLPHVFKKFYKGNSGRKNHGFGLGLSYVKWVCEIHDGHVNVVSKEGEGSVFKLIMPVFNNN